MKNTRLAFFILVRTLLVGVIRIDLVLFLLLHCTVVQYWSGHRHKLLNFYIHLYYQLIYAIFFSFWWVLEKVLEALIIHDILRFPIC